MTYVRYDVFRNEVTGLYAVIGTWTSMPKGNSWRKLHVDDLNVLEAHRVANEMNGHVL